MIVHLSQHLFLRFLSTNYAYLTISPELLTSPSSSTTAIMRPLGRRVMFSNNTQRNGKHTEGTCPVCSLPSGSTDHTDPVDHK